MTTRKTALGDLVQFTDECIEDTDPDGLTFIAAERGDLAHVISLPGSPDWADLYFERTQSIQTCHVSEFKFLGDMNTGTGRAPVPTFVQTTGRAN